ncbi:MAG: DUF1553 domain-containing protein [Acidobacteria bacterium]|nr:DUF1553 domain-containing protein [Acidobacteriota bacterium]
MGARGMFGLLFAVLAAQAAVDFNRDIRPILSDTCFTCHGPDEKHRAVNLRLDTKDGAFADRGGYQVIVPGSSAKSRLYQRVKADPKAGRMPPPLPGQPGLTARQLELVRQWIDEGAKWETHWAYSPPQRHPLPEVKNPAWAKNPIDRFILARLGREGLRPSPDADRITLLRRVSFDLTGLPPSPADVDALLADKSPGAYEKAVDRLLRSTRYGERMAMMWLDVARYADTHGYHIDSHRDMWPWRNWVIEAFNRNLPFDQFTVQQIAGDLLPGATQDQKIATGFNRNHMINFEGGAIPEEYQTEYVVDRVETTANAWLGMTLGCARCHDHKYDPIQQRDFYRFFAFFNTIPEKGLDGRTGNAEPLLALPSPEQRQREEALKARIAETAKALPEELLAIEQIRWEKIRAATLPRPTREGLVAHYEFDGHLADTSGFYQHGRIVRGEVSYGEGIAGRSSAWSGETQADLGNAGAFERGDKFTVSLWARSGASREMTVLQKLDAAVDRRGWEIVYDESQHIGDQRRGMNVQVNLIHRWPDEAIRIQTRQRLLQSDWNHIALLYDGSGKAAGLQLWVNGKPREIDILRDNLTGPIRTNSPLAIGDKALGQPFKGSLDDLRVYNRPIEAPEIENLAIHDPIRSALLSNGKRSREQKERLREYFLTRDAPEPTRLAYAELKRLRREKTELDKQIPTTMIMEEMEKPRETFILGRGDYRNKTEKVNAGVPTALPPLPPGAPSNRLGLAQWLVDPSHPLTARVTVNRFWQMYFGLGLVKTTEDFGSQGEAPSHPDLLDWLATEFIRTGWDVRAMQRLIVTSAAYRQASKVTPDVLDKDPENRLLARGPRFRLPAEMVRDNALAASGLLDPELGGRSVFPYSPKGLWEDVAYGDVFSAQAYPASTTRDLYRRSLYTFWKRTAPAASLATFDAPDREKCAARRLRTNTPLQALVLMNDPTYVEAARALAQRTIQEGGKDETARIAWAFRRATARKPTAKEAQALREVARKQIVEYRRDPDLAKRLLEVGASKYEAGLDPVELAAWTTVASVILNLDETITKE